MMLDLLQSRTIDLTLSLRPEMPGVHFETARTLEKDGWNAQTLHLYSHAGTHMDAPLHFGVSDATIDELTPSDCMGIAWIADVCHVGARGMIYPQDLGNVYTSLLPGDSLVLHTGWSKLVNHPVRYRDELPRISKALAEWCVEKRVKLLGVEPPSVADVNNMEEVTQIHEILLGGGVTIIEGLCRIEHINTARVWLMAFPLKIAGGDGAPARVTAIEIEDEINAAL